MPHRGKSGNRDDVEFLEASKSINGSPNPMRVLRYFDPERVGEFGHFAEDFALMEDFVADASLAVQAGWLEGLGLTFALTEAGAERLRRDAKYGRPA